MGDVFGTRGETDAAHAVLERSLRFSAKMGRVSVTMENLLLAELALWLNQASKARSYAERAGDFAAVDGFERDVIRAARLQGETALAADDRTALQRLEYALARARAVSMVEQELPCLIGLAKLRSGLGEPQEAREYLNDVWESAERGPYPLLHADALNVLAQIEGDQGNTGAAIAAATEAYRKAWCNGPPFAYHWGLKRAREHLAALGAPEPDLEPFDASKHDPMPEVELNPPDEFAGD